MWCQWPDLMGWAPPTLACHRQAYIYVTIPNLHQTVFVTFHIKNVVTLLAQTCRSSLPPPAKQCLEKYSSSSSSNSTPTQNTWGLTAIIPRLRKPGDDTKTRVRHLALYPPFGRGVSNDRYSVLRNQYYNIKISKLTRVIYQNRLWRSNTSKLPNTIALYAAIIVPSPCYMCRCRP